MAIINEKMYTELEMIYKSDEFIRKYEEINILEMVYKPNENKELKLKKIKKFKEKFRYIFEDKKEYLDDKLRILGKCFIKHNKNKCKLIYNNKKYKLTEYFKEIDDNYKINDIIKLKINGVDRITDISRIFYGCYHLSKVSEYQLDNNQYKINGLNNIFSEHNLDEETKSNISNRNYENSNGKNGLNKGFNQLSLSIPSFKNNSDIQIDFPILSRSSFKFNKISKLCQKI